MKIQDIYIKYQIPKHLQEHQIRVAAVAWEICTNLDKEVPTQEIITAALLHDMGNIIKFTFNSPLEPYKDLKKKEKLLKLQKKFIDKYGSDVEIATYKILQEISFPEELKKYFEWIGGKNIQKKIDQGLVNEENLENLILVYSDSRVSISGIVSLEERIDEVANRNPRVLEIAQTAKENTKRIEKIIFKHCKISPGDITDTTVSKYSKKLKNFNIPTNE